MQDPSTESSQAPSRPQWVVVGRIGRSVGLDGWVKVVSNTDCPERFSPGSRLFLQRKGEPDSTLIVSDARSFKAGDLLQVKFEGVSSVEDVKTLTGGTLVIPIAERAAPPPGSFYPDELTGMLVIPSDGNGTGILKSLESDVPSPYLVVDLPGTGEVSIPYRKVFIDAIDPKTRTIRLKTPFGDHIPGGHNAN